jgi:type I restriction enzyme S subunit
MAGEWITLGDVVVEARGGTSIKTSEYTTGGTPVLTKGDVKPAGRVEHGGKFVSTEFAKASGWRFSGPGDLIVTTRDLTLAANFLGLVSRIPEYDSFVVNQGATIFRIDESRIDPCYLVYWCCGSEYRQHIQDNYVGSTQIHIRQDDLFGAPLRLVPLSEQKAIAHVLGTLDDKIELNRRMNETLEAMARALFQSWFVVFDPVRAKAEGRDPGLPQHLADLFPDAFEDSELGEIPRGWGVGCVDDEFNLTMGQSPPGETYNESGEGLPFYQGRRDFGSRFPTQRVYCTAPTRFAKEGDTLISVRAPVGDINVAAEDCVIGRGVAAARHRTGSRSYTYQFMLAQEETFARFEGEGTVFGSMGKKDFHSIPCVVPSRNLVREFETRFGDIDSRVEANEYESRTLATLRDTLLPKLISGELRVQDAERYLGRVAP